MTIWKINKLAKKEKCSSHTLKYKKKYRVYETVVKLKLFFRFYFIQVNCCNLYLLESKLAREKRLDKNLNDLEREYLLLSSNGTSS